MRNYYQHKIELKKLDIRNDSKEKFIQQLEGIPYRGYEVESMANGKKIVIVKPGGKKTYGHPRKEDFIVFIYTPNEDGLWQITHKQLLADISSKAIENKRFTLSLIELLFRTLSGEDPNDFINEMQVLKFETGETVETLVKVYKWIWGQEDVNYPTGEGRQMSWKEVIKIKDNILKKVND